MCLNCGVGCVLQKLLPLPVVMNPQCRWMCSVCGVSITGIIAHQPVVSNDETCVNVRCRWCVDWAKLMQCGYVEVAGEAGAWVRRVTLVKADVDHLRSLVNLVVPEGYDFRSQTAGVLDYELVCSLDVCSLHVLWWLCTVNHVRGG